MVNLPNNEAVKAQTAPMPTGHVAQDMPAAAKATGSGAALSSIK